MLYPEEVGIIAFKNCLMSKREALKLINILKHEKLTCELCKHAFGKNAKITTDHIIPLSKNGNGNITNLQLTHEGCNKMKGNRIIKMEDKLWVN